MADRHADFCRRMSQLRYYIFGARLLIYDQACYFVLDDKLIQMMNVIIDIVIG